MAYNTTTPTVPSLPALSSDEMLARTIAMQDYMDFTDVDTNNNNNNSDNNTKNNNNNNNKTNPKALPSILNQECLPLVLQNYISSASIINLTNDINSINPNIYNLFIKYNYMYFNNKLDICEVKWSSRMTLCAGLCVYEGFGGLCSIRLSSKLLKYRSTKEVIETLIHEMIHAYLFVTFNNKDRESHGNRFKTLMNVINYVSTLNISIYHTFHDEVDEYRKHIWKCNGICSKKAPYYGIVKRSMNRKPQKSDSWWMKHLLECGGVFNKISEPKEFTEKQLKLKKRKEKKLQKNILTTKQKELNKKNKKNKKKNRKRKKMDNDDNIINNNNRTLLDMFGNNNEPPKKKQKINKINGNNGKKNNSKTNDNMVKVKCPICEKMFNETLINKHLDDCLSSTYLTSQSLKP